MRRLFSFPNPVNDAAARTVALGVIVQSVLALATGWSWVLIPLTYGFVARVLTGPTLSPLGQFATRVAAPRIRNSPLRTIERFVPGPPKRFAQAIGTVFSGTATVLWLTVGWSTARWVLVPLIAAASLEAFAGFCLGCTVFGWLMRAGVVPASVCEECGDLAARRRRLSELANS